MNEYLLEWAKSYNNMIFHDWSNPASAQAKMQLMQAYEIWGEVETNAAIVETKIL